MIESVTDAQRISHSERGVDGEENVAQGVQVVESESKKSLIPKSMHKAISMISSKMVAFHKTHSRPPYPTSRMDVINKVKFKEDQHSRSWDYTNGGNWHTNQLAQSRY